MIFTLVWIEEENRWYHFKGDVWDDTPFINGYVDYYIKVENNVITRDDLHPLNEGKLFNTCYDPALWD